MISSKNVPAFLLLALLMMSSLSLFQLPRAVGQASSPTLPNGLVFYVPIQISNSQPISTPAPFQQMITVDSATYSSYEAANLQNIEFFTSTGSIIPSWLESGNSNTATSAIYWLDLTSGIAANSQVTVYMGFASTSANLFNKVNTGETPQLSLTYGQYDDGQSVFSTLYQNFAGTTVPSGWTVQGGRNLSSLVKIDNGVNVTGSNPGNGGYVLSNSAFGLNPNQVLDVYAISNQPPQGFRAHLGVGYFAPSDLRVITSSAFWSFQGAANSIVDMEANSTAQSYNGHGNGEVGSLSASYDVYHVYTAYSPSASTDSFSVDYGKAETLTGEPMQAAEPVGMLQQNGTESSAVMNWIRIRAYPPNGVMPQVSFGSISTPSTSPTTMTVGCSPSEVLVNVFATCTATVSGSTPTGLVHWSTSTFSGTFSVTTCTLFLGACSIKYRDSSNGIPIITGTYSGNPHNQGSSNKFALIVTAAPIEAWAGYAVTGTDVTFVNGSWIVPRVSCTPLLENSESGFWIGISGGGRSTIEQIGTSSNCRIGTPNYWAWYQLFSPSNDNPVSITAFQPFKDIQICQSGDVCPRPGDTITASVRYNPQSNLFVFVIKDTTQHESYTTSQAAPGAQLIQADWITECSGNACTDTNMQGLSKFVKVDFGTDYTSAPETCFATINGISGPIGSFPHSSILRYEMVDSNDIYLARPSSLTPDGTSFSVTWLASK